MRRAVATLAWALPAICQSQGAKKPIAESLLLGDIPSVFGASRFDQLVTEAPASVSVITADDIATYGWRTLADVLRTVRGFYVTNDRTYSYVGTRGFARAGDYNSRLLLLIDGVRINDNIYGAAYVAMEGLVDLSTVDRIEVIRGPASSLYGTSAFFGIINVVTLRGRAQSGVRVAGELGSFGARQLSVGGGHRTKSGLELFGNASTRRVDGQNFYFPEFDAPPLSDGIASSRDREDRNRLFGKAEWGAFALEGAINLRDKRIPTASYETNFNQGRQTFRDHTRNIALRYQQAGGERSNLSGSISLNRYDYDGVYPYPNTITNEWAQGRWGVAEAQYSRLIAGRHRLVVGGAYTQNWRKEQGLVDEAGQPPSFFDTTTGNTSALFALGEFRVGNRLIVNGGLRLDHSADVGNNWNPRAALIYTLGEGSAAKVLYGDAFRAANNWERFYNDNGRTQKANPAISPERVSTLEALVEKVVTRHLKLTASAYRYRARQLIDLGTDPLDGLLQFNNLGRAAGEGVETEAELDFGAVTGRASYSMQRARNPETEERLSNSPQHLGALNLSFPIAARRGRVGFELRGMSARLTPRGDDLGGHVVANLTLTGRRFRGIEAAASLTNVFDAAFSDPVGEEHVQRGIQQDGRALRVTLAYVF